MLLWYIGAGAAVGFTIGLTGVGGGSLMTPLLLLFGFPPQVAIGTDLLYAGITKTGAAVLHARQDNVDWRIVRLLAAGSLPGAGLTSALLALLGRHARDYSALLTASLGLMLIATAGVLLFRRPLQRLASAGGGVLARRAQAHGGAITLATGGALGVLVTLSSVGAGALGTALLLLLYPALGARRIVGTELTHAVPLTLVAGLGHLGLGHVDPQLLAALLLGSLPAIHLGTRLGSHLPSRLLNSLLAFTLMSLGVKYAFF